MRVKKLCNEIQMIIFRKKILLIALEFITLNTGKLWKLYILPEQKVEEIKEVFNIKEVLRARAKQGGNRDFSFESERSRNNLK